MGNANEERLLPDSPTQKRQIPWLKWYSVCRLRCKKIINPFLELKFQQKYLASRAIASPNKRGQVNKAAQFLPGVKTILVLKGLFCQLRAQEAWFLGGQVF